MKGDGTAWEAGKKAQAVFREKIAAFLKEAKVVPWFEVIGDTAWKKNQDRSSPNPFQPQPRSYSVELSSHFCRTVFDLVKPLRI